MKKNCNEKKLRIDKLRRKDYKTIIKSASIGMHFDWYMEQKWLQNMYGKYFLYSELLAATNIYTAYYGDEFAGLMLINQKNEKKIYRSFFKSLYVKFFNFIERCVDNEVDIYDKTNDMMLARYEENNAVDGEISFLAANPNLKIRGIGSFLLAQAEKDLKDKKLYLFTDNACNYGFYEHMGFSRVDCKSIVLNLPKGDIPLECYLFTKVFGSSICE